MQLFFSILLLLGFSPSKTEQQLQSTEWQEKDEKDNKNMDQILGNVT